MAHIFMTGSTGFIGMYALKELADAQEIHTITALVRSRTKWELVCKQIGLDSEQMGRMTPVIGDLSVPHLGLSESCAPSARWRFRLLTTSRFRTRRRQLSSCGSWDFRLVG
ncbi:SDR family oxidoreductase [Paenibacillus sedimenti]|nr:SDR family oxidoreductase [Paenibacillus sedimenti]